MAVQSATTQRSSSAPRTWARLQPDLAEPAGSTAVEATTALADTRVQLDSAQEHLRRLDEQTADLAGELEGVIAARGAMRPRGKGHHTLADAAVVGATRAARQVAGGPRSIAC